MAVGDPPRGQHRHHVAVDQQALLMGMPKRFYCPFCGTKISLNEHRYLKMSVAHGMDNVTCFSPDCTGDPSE
jgi:hypothetical protein